MIKTFTLKRATALGLFFALVSSLWAQIPTGYYTAAEGQTGAALKTQLSNIISAGAVDLGYDGLYTIYQTSDVMSSGKIWDMYSMKADGTANYYFGAGSTDRCGSYSTEGDCYNREHTFCDSWLGEKSPQRSDAHHIIPTDGYVNNRRSSYPHGKVGTVSWTSSNGSKLGTADASTGYTGTVFEPIDEFKGDFARMYFYVATRYESQIAGWVSNGSASEILAGNAYPAYKSWFYNMMVQWSDQDPVSQKEIDRNNAIYALQNNRNPYIDHPELVDYIWGSKVGQAWSSSGVAYPVLSSPTFGSSVAFGKIMYGESASTTIQVKGSNLTDGLSFALSGANAADYSVSTAAITQAEAEAGYTLTIHYNANAMGSSAATLSISGGGITTVSVNLSATVTDGFDALAATQVGSTGFTANWSSSAAATGYELNVYYNNSTGESQSVTLLEDEFTSLASWTATGYTSVTDKSGYVRLSSGSNPGVISSGALDMSAATTLTVKAMAYGTNDAGAKLTVKVGTDSITSFTTAVALGDFSYDIPAKTSSSKLVLSAKSGSGNRVFIDYVKLTTKTSPVVNTSVTGYPLQVGNVLSHEVTGLTPASTYYYTVTPQGNSAAASSVVTVTTATVTDIKEGYSPTIQWVYTPTAVLLRNVPQGSDLVVMNMTGAKVQSLHNVASEVSLSLNLKGVYILQVRDHGQVSSYKLSF